MEVVGCLAPLLTLVILTDTAPFDCPKYLDQELCPGTDPIFCAEASCRRCSPLLCSHKKYKQRYREGCCDTKETLEHSDCMDICLGANARHKLLRYDNGMKSMTTLCPEGYVIYTCTVCRRCLELMCTHWAEKQIFEQQCLHRYKYEDLMVKECQDLWHGFYENGDIASTEPTKFLRTPGDIVREQNHTDVTRITAVTSAVPLSTPSTNLATTSYTSSYMIGVISFVQKHVLGLVSVLILKYVL